MKSLREKPSKFVACFVAASFFAASSLAFAQDAGAPPPPETNDQAAPSASHGWPRASEQQQNPYPVAQADANQAPAPQAQDQGAAPPAPPQGSAPSANPPYRPGPYANGQNAPYPPYANGQNAPYPPYANGQNAPYPPYTNGQNAPYPPYANGQNGPNGPYAPNPYGAYNGPQPPPAPPIPAQLTITPGTYVTVRVNQVLSSEHNQKGDAFAATLVQPVVVNGVVVAEPGETLGGQVAESQPSGRVKGLARLGVQLTDLTLADGQKVPVQTQLIARKAPSTVGRDAGAIAGTTALGAAIGAAANWGTGAAVGAGAGLLLGTLGVLVTKGAPSVIYPEQVLTFKIEAPVQISTANAPQAFHYIEPGEYDRPTYASQPAPRYAYAPPAPYLGPAYYPYPAPYPYYSPYWYGPRIGVWIGPGFYRGHYYYGRYWRR